MNKLTIDEQILQNQLAAANKLTMTFPARLTELMNNAVLHPGSLNDDELSEFLVNHAEAIRDLVVAAEKHREFYGELAGIGIIKALAKLEIK